MTMTPAVLATRDTCLVDRHENEHDPAARRRRRMFPAEKKLALLAEYDAADREGKGALLRAPPRMPALPGARTST
ncbi:MAG: hypothetical protein KY462_04130 [Actinobacteria bacterium]|nr:hypothetical protein [Actinomycetota bacterium]